MEDSASPSALRLYLDYLRAVEFLPLLEPMDRDKWREVPLLAALYGELKELPTLVEKLRPAEGAIQLLKYRAMALQEIEQRQLQATVLPYFDSLRIQHDRFLELCRTIPRPDDFELHQSIRDWINAYADCWAYVTDPLNPDDFLQRYQVAHVVADQGWMRYRQKMIARGKSENPIVVDDERDWLRNYSTDQLILSSDPDYLEFQQATEASRKLDEKLRERTQQQAQEEYDNDPYRGGASPCLLRLEIERLKDAWKDYRELGLNDPAENLRQLWGALGQIGIHHDSFPFTVAYDFKARMRSNDDTLDFQAWTQFHQGLNTAMQLIDNEYPIVNLALPTAAELNWHADKLDQLAAEIQLSGIRAKSRVSFYLCFDKDHPSHNGIVRDDEGQRPISQIFTAVFKANPRDVRLADALRTAAGTLGAFCANRIDGKEAAEKLRGAADIIREQTPKIVGPDKSQEKIGGENQTKPKGIRKPRGNPKITGTKERYRMNVVKAWIEYNPVAEKERNISKKETFVKCYSGEFPGLTVTELNQFLDWQRQRKRQKSRK